MGVRFFTRWAVKIFGRIFLGDGLHFWNVNRCSFMRSRYLEPEEIEKLRLILGAEAWLPYQISIDTGLRIGDVAKLRWKDIQGSRIRYVAQKTRKAGEALLGCDTSEFVWTLRKNLRPNENAYVFPSPEDARRHITRQALWKRLKHACVLAGVNPEGASPHSCRKVYGVREYHAHGLTAVREGLQHSDARTTEIYALADWLSPENANKPILRGDIGVLIQYIADWLGKPIGTR